MPGICAQRPGVLHFGILKFEIHSATCNLPLNKFVSNFRFVSEKNSPNVCQSGAHRWQGTQIAGGTPKSQLKVLQLAFCSVLGDLSMQNNQSTAGWRMHSVDVLRFLPRCRASAGEPILPNLYGAPVGAPTHSSFLTHRRRKKTTSWSIRSLQETR